MPITISLALSVAELTDNEIAFANAAAWNNYFNDLSGTATLDPVTVTGYTSSPYDTDLAPHQLDVDTGTYIFPTIEMFTSLQAELATLNANYVTLRAELYAAGLISAP